MAFGLESFKVLKILKFTVSSYSQINWGNFWPKSICVPSNKKFYGRFLQLIICDQLLVSLLHDVFSNEVIWELETFSIVH